MKEDVKPAPGSKCAPGNAIPEIPQRKLETLSAEFDAVLARMQTAAARAGMKRAFHASEERLGKAAAAAARKSG